MLYTMIYSNQAEFSETESYAKFVVTFLHVYLYVSTCSIDMSPTFFPLLLFREKLGQHICLHMQ